MLPSGHFEPSTARAEWLSAEGLRVYEALVTSEAAAASAALSTGWTCPAGGTPSRLAAALVGADWATESEVASRVHAAARAEGVALQARAAHDGYLRTRRYQRPVGLLESLTGRRAGRGAAEAEGSAAPAGRLGPSPLGRYAAYLATQGVAPRG